MTEHWSARPEGGGRFAIWLIRAIALRCGRSCARAFLYPAILYFFLRRRYERLVSYAFLERALGRKATAREVMRHMHCFASTMLDRVFLLSDRYARFDVRVHGLEELTSRMQPQRGVLLLGAHVGSFEVLRVLAMERPDVKVCVVLDTQKTPALTELLHQLNPGVARNVIDASRPGTEIVLALGEAVREGALVTLLADRAREHESTVIVDFMGAPAPFPAAPFLIGALLKVPMVICIGMYRGGNRYDLYFEPFADELVLPRHARKTELRAVAQRYAARLEHHVRQDPYNWFNWHDFWNLEGLDHARPDAGERDLAEPVSRGA
ncbi:MAG TPA: acyltransferase [Rhodanobacteraceae bacterium]|jgi:predicted LPLAT superfamily acyltransferase|nr:acyltransferase [Rhodanobacteraceae bacterium]